MDGGGQKTSGWIHPSCREIPSKIPSARFQTPVNRAALGISLLSPYNNLRSDLCILGNGWLCTVWSISQWSQCSTNSRFTLHPFSCNSTCLRGLPICLVTRSMRASRDSIPAQGRWRKEGVWGNKAHGNRDPYSTSDIAGGGSVVWVQQEQFRSPAWSYSECPGNTGNPRKSSAQMQPKP